MALLLAALMVTVQLTMEPSAAAHGWTVVAGPNANSNTDTLTSVSCSDDYDCTAVGFTDSGYGDETLIETLNDGTWSIVTSPSPITTIVNVLSSVSCTTDDTCTAVGHGSNESAGPTRVLIETDGVNEGPPSETPEVPFALALPLGAGVVIAACCEGRRRYRRRAEHV